MKNLNDDQVTLNKQMENHEKQSKKKTIFKNVAKRDLTTKKFQIMRKKCRETNENNLKNADVANVNKLIAG